MEGVEQRKACVTCSASQPSDGKLLYCLHVMCVGCLNDSIGDPGSVTCPRCWHITSPRWTGVDLSKQLADSRPLLYATAAKPMGTGSLYGRGAAAEEDSESDVKVMCESCSDIDIVRVATHKCVDCSDEPFCQQHAERHISRKQFSVHCIQSQTKVAGRQGQGFAVQKASHRCVLHAKYKLAKFCRTCHRSICERCLAIGHRQHLVEEIDEAADVERSILLEAIAQARGPRSAAATATPAERATPVTTYIRDVAQEMERVKEDSQRASKVVTDVFAQVNLMVEKAQQRVLNELDSRCWNRLEPLQTKSHRLQELQLTECTSVEIASLLVATNSDNLDVLQLSHCVKDHLTKLTADLKAECNITGGDMVVARASDTLDRLEVDLNSVVLIEGCSVDLSASDFAIPAATNANEELLVVLQLRSYRNEPVSAASAVELITCILTDPSGQKSRVPLCTQQCASKAAAANVEDNAIHIKLKPRLPGQHQLEIGAGAGTRSATFEVLLGISLDPEKCPKEITLSEDNHVATSTRQVNRFVLAKVGYRAGVHQWSAKVHVCNIEGGEEKYVAVGVSPIPGGTYTTQFVKNQSYFWRSTGSAQPVGENSTHWRNGDTITFTLDCDKRTLEMHLHRNGERRVLKDIDTSKELYPGVYLYLPGQKVELL